MKKIYQKPDTKVVILTMHSQLLTVSGEVGETGVGMNWNQNVSGSEEALSRETDFWGDEDY